MKKYEHKAILIKAEVHRIIQLSAKYFGCTQSQMIDLLLQSARLSDSDNVKKSSIRLFDEHIEYYHEHDQRKPGLQEFLNQIEEK